MAAAPMTVMLEKQKQKHMPPRPQQALAPVRVTLHNKRKIAMPQQSPLPQPKLQERPWERQQETRLLPPALLHMLATMVFLLPRLLGTHLLHRQRLRL